ncbi:MULTISPECIES: Crp/Fnr family transcriptional regulator [Rhodomicrobium]|uniref:Crp/Fnr family transcriptional regulator n=1 Tax=Rhodomicrobium TaxID=1068 RepID=UPI001482E492|nr:MULTISPECIES: Crp/Fnr family transcriptional regulator [Rhodomicrobium]
MNRQFTIAGKTPLSAIPLLSTISAESLRKIEKHAKRMSFGKGKEIIARSEDMNDVFLLVSGMARVMVFSASGKAVGFRRIDAGDLFGEFSAIDGEKRSASVEAATPCVVLCMGSALFRDLMESDPAFMNAVLGHLVRLLRSLTGRIIEFSTLAVKNRIHSEILRMARLTHDGSGEYQISPAPTHSEIAGRISTHREAVSREISRLKALGIIERRGRVMAVKDFPRLERMVHEASGE